MACGTLPREKRVAGTSGAARSSRRLQNSFSRSTLATWLSVALAHSSISPYHPVGDSWMLPVTRTFGTTRATGRGQLTLYWSQPFPDAHMAKPVPLPPPGFDDLSVDEKIDYLQSLWDRIAATPETIPVPDWHREIIDERLKDLEADPDAGDSWEVVQERLRKKFDSRH